MSIGNQMIDDMTKVIDQAKYDMWVCKAHQIGDFTNHSKNIATALYNADYRKQNEWISVEDRLPERCGHYLTYTTRGTIEISRFYPFYVNDTSQFDYWITHWMPLPEAPKTGGAE